MRPEVTRRRDHSAPMAWFRRKARGHLGMRRRRDPRGGVRRAGRHQIFVELVDNKAVGPGLLVRQGFEDADIGRFKTDALAERLKRIEPDLETVVSTDDLILRITGPDPVHGRWTWSSTAQLHWPFGRPLSARSGRCRLTPCDCLSMSIDSQAAMRHCYSLNAQPQRWDVRPRTAAQAGSMSKADTFESA